MDPWDYPIRFAKTAAEDGFETAISETFSYLETRCGRRIPATLVPASVSYRYYGLRARLVPAVSDANPLDLRYVDPNAIEWYAHEHHELGEIVDRELDLLEMEDHWMRESLRQRFADGREWERTPLYGAYFDAIQSDTETPRCSTVEELDRYCARIDAIYERIEREGYRSQRELLRERPERTYALNNDERHPIFNEIGVSITADGKIVRTGTGRHRHHIAQLLDLQAIPVLVRGRHADWQAVRDRVRMAESATELPPTVSDLLDHPDLQDIRPDRPTTPRHEDATSVTLSVL